MHSLFFHSANSVNLTSSLLFPNNHKLCSKPRFQSSIKINTPIPKHVPNKKVIILWDLDNKPPRGPPYDAALSLKTLAERFGDVVSISAYTKRHSFFNLPQWNTNQNPNPNSIPCRVCGHECKSIFDLKIHFKRVHLYQPAGNVVAPRVGFGLGSELRRAGVFVKVEKVGEKGNAVELWLKREMMSGEVGWLVLVSDNREFAEMLRKLPWNVVENGKLEGMGLMGKTEGLDDELEGDQDLDYGEYVTEEELYESANSVNLTSSLLFPNNHKLCSKPRFQSSIKINTPITKHVPNKKVIILWDLDNKPPRGPPYDVALSLKTLAERFGDVVSISAYTKRHSFFNLPQWNTNQNPNPNSIPCRVCGHECKSTFDLKIHFKRVHLYQRKKLREKLKSIKLSRSKVWFVRRIHTYNERC
ncbi:hypothetical protein KIW84_UN0343 [Lathyrus oleraceus]|nr:hypothetical protein KIW84_UN0343 [Pisum sativum]